MHTNVPPVGRVFEEELEEDAGYQSAKQRLAEEARKDDLMFKNLMDANPEDGFTERKDLQVIIEEDDAVSLESKKPLSLIDRMIDSGRQKVKKFATKVFDFSKGTPSSTILASLS